MSSLVEYLIERRIGYSAFARVSGLAPSFVRQVVTRGLPRALKPAQERKLERMLKYAEGVERETVFRPAPRALLLQHAAIARGLGERGHAKEAVARALEADPARSQYALARELGISRQRVSAIERELGYRRGGPGRPARCGRKVS